MSFSLALLLLVLLVLIALALGYGWGYRDGSAASFDEGYDFALTDNEVNWRIITKGLPAWDADREPLAELSLHSSHQPSTLNHQPQ